MNKIKECDASGRISIGKQLHGRYFRIIKSVSSIELIPVEATSISTLDETEQKFIKETLANMPVDKTKNLVRQVNQSGRITLGARYAGRRFEIKENADSFILIEKRFISA